MRIIWLSGICVVIMVILLVIGERTLPLFGGDIDLAAKVHKSVFMLLGAGILVGLIPGASRFLANFLREHIRSTADEDGVIGRWRRFLIRHDIPRLYEKAGPILAIFMGLAGIVMAAVIFLS